MTGLKEKRLKLGETQSKIAQVLGVKKHTVCQWETGKRTPRKDKLILLAKYFNCHVEELF